MRRYVPDINAATKEELERIPGISEDAAEAIIRYRDETGGIGDFEELLAIDAITQNDIDHLRPWLRVGEDVEST